MPIMLPILSRRIRFSEVSELSFLGRQLQLNTAENVKGEITIGWGINP